MRGLVEAGLGKNVARHGVVEQVRPGRMRRGFPGRSHGKTGSTKHGEAVSGKDGRSGVWLARQGLVGAQAWSSGVRLGAWSGLVWRELIELTSKKRSVDTTMVISPAPV